jgi:hypothetical protein
MAHLYTLSIAMLKPLVSVKRVCYFTAEILAVPIYTPWCDAPNFGHIKYLRWTEEETNLITSNQVQSPSIHSKTFIPKNS